MGRHPEIKDVIVTLLEEGTPKPVKTEEGTETARSSLPRVEA
ncbi:hypothetical protein [Thermococcus sp. JCM 11816]